VVLSLLISTSFLALIANPVQATPDEWGVDWLDGFHCRKLHEIGPSAGAGTGYDVGIKVYNGTGTDGTEIVAGIEYGKVYINETRWKFDDIRFTASDKLTLLPFWKENYTANVSANFWVKISANLNTTLTTIYVYWDNQYAVDGSCGEATFEFYDHFANQVWQKNLILPIPTNDWHYTEPTLLYETGRQLITGIGPVFKLWYRAQFWTGGTYLAYIKYAESNDCISWVNTTILVADPDPSGNHFALPFVCHVGAYYYLYIHGHLLNAADCWRSANGVTGWTMIKANTIVGGTSGQWDDWIMGNQFVWKEGATWYMMYDANGNPGFEMWQEGLATSPDGITWTKYGGNPVIGNASYYAGGFHYQKVGSTYYAWGQSTTSSTHILDVIDRLQSTDLHTWTRAAGIPSVFPLEPTDLTNVDPSIVYARGNVWMIYTAITDAYHWRGLTLARAGMPFDQLVQTQENQAYTNSTKWSGETDYMNVTASIATLNGHQAGVASAVINTIRKDFGPGTSARFKGIFKTPSDGVGCNAFFNNKYFPTGVTLQAGLSYTAVPSNTISVYDGASTVATTNINNANSVWDMNWQTAYFTAKQNGVEKMNCPLTTHVPTNTDMTLAFDVKKSTNQMTLDYVFVRPFVVSEPAHGGWSDLCVYSYSGIPIPPTPGGYSNENVLWALFALTIIIMCVGVIYHKLY
jgi:hypothetical protein